MTMHAEYVQTGAAATRRASVSNPMELLNTLRERNPTESFERQFTKWRQLVERNDKHLTSALLYAFRNYWSALDRDQRAERRSEIWKSEQVKEKAEQEQQVQQLVKQVKTIVLMDMMLPNGKKLRDASFADCTKAGGWYRKIAKKGRPHQIVGAVLTEEQLRTIK